MSDFGDPLTDRIRGDSVIVEHPEHVQEPATKLPSIWARTLRGEGIPKALGNGFVVGCVRRQVMEMTKTNHDQVIKLPEFVMSVLRWHVDKQLITREMERSELLFPSEVGGFRSNSALAKPFRGIAKAMRRSFQDAMREAKVANVVVRSISGHLTDQMQQRYSTARGHEQESAIARIIDLTRVQRPVREERGSGMDSNVDSLQGTAQGERLTGAHQPAYFPALPCRHDWVRTSDPYRVKVVLYH